MTSTPPPPGPPPTSEAPPRSTVWDTVRAQGVARSSGDQWFGGVCSGLARHLGVDPILIRAGMIALALLGGFGVAAYLIAWLVLPDESGRIVLQGIVGESEAAAAVTLVVLVAVAGVGVAAITSDGTLFSGGFVPLLVAGGAAYWLLRKRQQCSGGHSGPSVTAAPPPPPPGATSSDVSSDAGAPSDVPPADARPADTPSATDPEWRQPGAVGVDPASPAAGPPPPPPLLHQPLHPPSSPVATHYRDRRPRVSQSVLALLVGTALVGYGLGHVLRGPVGFAHSGHLLGMMIALGVMGLGAVALGLWGRRSAIAGLLTLGIALGVNTAMFTNGTGGIGHGDRATWTPTTATESFDLGAGEAVLDLRNLPAGTGTVRAELGAGSLVILVRDDAPITVRANVGLGSTAYTEAAGQKTQSGPGTETELVIGTPSRIVVDAQLGMGSIEIKEQQ